MSMYNTETNNRKFEYLWRSSWKGCSMDEALEIQWVEDFLKGYPDLDADAVILCLRMRRLTRDVLRNIDQYFAQSGLSRSRFDVLRALFHHPDQALTPTELAAEVGITRASMTSNLDELEEQGLIRRGPHPNDRRRISIHLSEKGHEFMVEELPHHYEQSALVLSHLTEDERSALLALYGRVALGTKHLLTGHSEATNESLQKK